MQRRDRDVLLLSDRMRLATIFLTFSYVTRQGVGSKTVPWGLKFPLKSTFGYLSIIILTIFTGQTHRPPLGVDETEGE